MKFIEVPDYIESSFGANYFFIDGQAKYKFYVVEIGLLNVAHGKIIACDPFLFNNNPPFTDAFPIGRFPVQLAIAKTSDNDERIGFSRIKFSEAQPLTWTMAVCEGQNADDLEADDIFGYGVDSGTGAFMDTSDGENLLNYLKADEDYCGKLIDEMDKTYKHTRSWLLWQKDASNVAMFSTGWGDGHYATYVGYDSNNNICRLVTDFGLFDWGH